jgi:hypothetical protein
MEDIQKVLAAVGLIIIAIVSVLFFKPPIPNCPWCNQSTGVGETWCYQESANTSNQSGTDGSCGLDYSGSYAVDGSITDLANAYDGDWGTLAFQTVPESPDNQSAVAQTDNLTVVYVKPPNALNTTLWPIKVSNTSTLTANLSIPQDCWSASETNLTLRQQIYDHYVYYTTLSSGNPLAGSQSNMLGSHPEATEPWRIPTPTTQLDTGYFVNDIDTIIAFSGFCIGHYIEASWYCIGACASDLGALIETGYSECLTSDGNLLSSWDAIGYDSGGVNGLLTQEVNITNFQGKVSYVESQCYNGTNWVTLNKTAVGTTGPELFEEGMHWSIQGAGVPSTNLSIWNGTTYLPYNDTNRMKIRCGQPPGLCTPTNQNSTQGILLDMNNGTDDSTYQQIKVNTTWSGLADLLCDDVNVTTGAINVTTTYQNYSTSTLSQGANQSIWCWLNVTSSNVTAVSAMPRSFTISVDNK